MSFTDIPDAVGAVVAAVLQTHPCAPPRRQAQLVLAELRLLGWHVGPPGSCSPAVEVPESCTGSGRS